MNEFSNYENLVKIQQNGNLTEVLLIIYYYMYVTFRDHIFYETAEELQIDTDLYYSYLRPSVCVMVWWHWDPVERGRRVASMFWWRRWQTVGLHTGKWGWTPRLSLHLRCSAVWMWQPMTGQMASSPLSGGGHWKQRKVCNILPLKTDLCTKNLHVWGKVVSP